MTKPNAFNRAMTRKNVLIRPNTQLSNRVAPKRKQKILDSLRFQTASKMSNTKLLQMPLLFSFGSTLLYCLVRLRRGSGTSSSTLLLNCKGLATASLYFDTNRSTRGYRSASGISQIGEATGQKSVLEVGDHMQLLAQDELNSVDEVFSLHRLGVVVEFVDREIASYQIVSETLDVVEYRMYCKIVENIG